MPVVYLVDKFSVAELTEVGRSLLEVFMLNSGFHFSSHTCQKKIIIMNFFSCKIVSSV